MSSAQIYLLAKVNAELPGILEAAKAAGLARLEVDLDGARLVALWPSGEVLQLDASLVDAGHGSQFGPTPAQIAQGARVPLPWDHYAPELRDALKGLLSRFPAEAVADAAVRLAELVALHGTPRPRQSAAEQ